MTITPDDLRALADGLANQNSEAERVAARYAASADMLDALKRLMKDLEERARAAGRVDADGIFILSAGATCVRLAYEAIAKAERAEP